MITRKKSKRHDFFDPVTKRIEIEFETFLGHKRIVKGYVTEADNELFYVRQDNGKEIAMSIGYLAHLMGRNNNDK